MSNIRYDSFYKFVVSIGLLFIMLPAIVMVFLCSDSFDLYISERKLNTYTKTAQDIIYFKQTIPLLIKSPVTWIMCGVIMILGGLMLIYGIKNWKRMQTIEDKQRESEKDKTVAEAKQYLNQISKEMDERQIINKYENETKAGEFLAEEANYKKCKLIEQKIEDRIRINYESSHAIKSNIIISDYEFDIVALANNRFDKDRIYEIKYLQKEVSVDRIRKLRDDLQGKREIFSKKTNHLAYVVLILVVSNEIYNNVLSAANNVTKRNNYSIQVYNENDLDSITIN